MFVVTAVMLSLGADKGVEWVFRYGVGVSEVPPPSTDGHEHHPSAHP